MLQEAGHGLGFGPEYAQGALSAPFAVVDVPTLRELLDAEGLAGKPALERIAVPGKPAASEQGLQLGQGLGGSRPLRLRILRQMADIGVFTTN